MATATSAHSAVTTSRHRAPANRRHHLRRRHRAVDAATAVRRRPRRRLHTAERPAHEARDRYVIVGAGKTAMDTCLWLLRHGIAPQRLTWIKPRDAWLLNRADVQPGPQFAKKVLADVSAQLKSVQLAESVEDLFARLADAGCLLRIDESVEPEMYRCAIVSQAELEWLRRIDDVVRMGHVKAIEPGRVVLDGGSSHRTGSALYIDCTAVGLGRGDVTPYSTPTASPCRPSAPVSRSSAPPSSHTSKPPTPTTTPGMRSADPFRTPRSRWTGCE